MDESNSKGDSLLDGRDSIKEINNLFKSPLISSSVDVREGLLVVSVFNPKNETFSTKYLKKKEKKNEK